MVSYNIAGPDVPQWRLPTHSFHESWTDGSALDGDYNYHYLLVMAN